MDPWIQLARWEDAVDVAAVALLAWLAIRYIRRTRARAATLGLAVLGVAYAVATGLDLRLTASLFQGFFAAVVIVVVVIFQEDFRRFLEQLGSWRPGRTRTADHGRNSSVLARVVSTLADQRTGALIVLPRGEPLDRHIDGGVVLNGRLSEPLLLSLFDASSPGHDGAVIVRDDVVERFAVHLPLSADHDQLESRGTRHAAALGLAERCDALCIVVSEERGSIAVAQHGELKTVRSPDLVARLEAGQVDETRGLPFWRRGVWLDALAAIVAALAIWLVFVPGSDVAELVVAANVEVANLPDDLALGSIDPPDVAVTLRGLRRDLILAESNAITVRIDGYLAKFGRRTFLLANEEVRHPAGLDIVGISPEKVRLSLVPVEGGQSSE